MFRLSCLVVFLFPLCAGWVAAVEAPITRVVLYPGSASIERTAQVSAGTRLLEIEGRPSLFDSKTLLVQADRGIRIGQVVVNEASRKEGVHPREKELKKKILALKDQIETLDIEVKSANLVTAYLDRLGGTAPGDRGVADERRVQGVAAGIETAAARAFQRVQRAEIGKRALKDELERAEFELGQFQSGARNTRSVSVQLLAEAAGQVRLSYQLNRAGWQPAYRAALDSGSATVELERLAQISQKTGEDWVGVKLRLSTGQPNAFREPVDPQTRRLVYNRPVVREERAVAMMAAPAPVARKAMAAHPDDDYVAPVIETLGAFASEFDVPGKVTLPADGREVAVSLGKQTHAAKQRVQVTPGVNKNAVLVAEFERSAGVWLAGNIQLYRDSSYVGATRWNPSTSERFSLGFGQDDLLRVTVDRKTLLDGKTGFVSQKLQRKLVDSYVLSNRHRNAIEVLVLESSPVSQSQEVEVERHFDPLPGEADWKGRTGVVAWSRALAPEETWKIDVGYTITYPPEGSVSGLP